MEDALFIGQEGPEPVDVPSEAVKPAGGLKGRVRNTGHDLAAAVAHLDQVQLARR